MKLLDELQNRIVTSRILREGRIQKNKYDNNYHVFYNGKLVMFLINSWDANPLNEIFFKEVYHSLNVKDRIVIDIGASIGDSAIYFMLNGANHVFGYEINKERYKQGLYNIRLNGFSKDITLFNKEYDGNIRGDVMKVDIDGGEYELLNSPAFLKNKPYLKETIIEYHDKSSNKGIALVHLKLSPT